MAKIIIDIPDKTLEYASKGKDLSEEQVEDIQTAISDGIIILNNVTNGEVIETLFPDVKSRLDEKTGITVAKWGDDTSKCFRTSWWNSPYKRGNEDGNTNDSV